MIIIFRILEYYEVKINNVLDAPNSVFVLTKVWIFIAET